MLAEIVLPTNDFLALADYLIHGRERPTHPDRVAWVRTHNLPTTDPMAAARLMAATAELSKRCKAAAYHVMIAWAPEELPTPQVMQEIAARTLELAGLAEHQALVMGHGDKPHRHLHMLINRVHPETGKTWRTAHDYARFDRIMKELADAYGFRHVPTHTYDPEATDDTPRKPGKRATWAARRGARTDRPQWPRRKARAYGARLSEDLDAAAGFDDLAFLVAEDGLTLEPKGTGYVVGNGAAYAKLSSLKLTSTAKPFERPHGRDVIDWHRMADGPRPVLTVDAIDILKALAVWGLADRDDIREAVEAATAERAARRDQGSAFSPKGRRLATTSLATLAPSRDRRASSAPRSPPRRAPALPSRGRG